MSLVFNLKIQVEGRGLDIKSIKNVINYETARDIQSHVHRIGNLQLDLPLFNLKFNLKEGQEEPESMELRRHCCWKKNVISLAIWWRCWKELIRLFLKNSWTSLTGFDSPEISLNFPGFKLNSRTPGSKRTGNKGFRRRFRRKIWRRTPEEGEESLHRIFK